MDNSKLSWILQTESGSGPVYFNSFFQKKTSSCLPKYLAHDTFNWREYTQRYRQIIFFWLFRNTIFPRNSVPFRSELRNGLFRGIWNSVGMSTFFRGITESVPRLYRGIFSERNSVANPSVYPSAFGASGGHIVKKVDWKVLHQDRVPQIKLPRYRFVFLLLQWIFPSRVMDR